MSVQSYDEAAAQAASSDLAGVISGLRGSLDQLTSYVAAVKNSWDGDEQEQYVQIQTTWDTSAATVSEILGVVDKSLGENTESVKGMRGRVKGSLAG